MMSDEKWTRLFDGVGKAGSSLAKRVTITSLVIGCGAKVSTHIEGETHWLSACNREAECRDEYSCVCGICTLSCEQASACGELDSDAVCSVSTATTYAGQCASDERDQRICVRVDDVGATSAPEVSTSESATSASAEQGGDCAMSGVAPALEPTPRANRQAEILAVLASDNVIALEEDYTRAVRDHAALVAWDPRFASFWVTTAKPAVGDTLTVQLSSEPSSEFEQALRCQDVKYGATSTIEKISSSSEQYYVEVTLDGVFNLDLVTLEYARLPGVFDVYPNVLTPPPVIVEDAVYVTGVTRKADTWTYSATITKLRCNVQLSVAVDSNGGVELVAWGAVPDELPEAADCQRPAM